MRTTDRSNACAAACAGMVSASCAMVYALYVLFGMDARQQGSTPAAALLSRSSCDACTMRINECTTYSVTGGQSLT